MIENQEEYEKTLRLIKRVEEFIFLAELDSDFKQGALKESLLAMYWLLGQYYSEIKRYQFREIECNNTNYLPTRKQKLNVSE